MNRRVVTFGLVAVLLAAMAARAERPGPSGAQVIVPNLVGLTEQAAQQTLKRLNLALTTTPAPLPRKAAVGTVVGQAPSAGSRVAAGAVVQLKVVPPMSPEQAALERLQQRVGQGSKTQHEAMRKLLKQLK